MLGVTVGAFGANLCKSADKMYRGILRCLLDWLSNKRLVIEEVASICSFVCPILGKRQTVTNWGFSLFGLFVWWGEGVRDLMRCVHLLGFHLARQSDLHFAPPFSRSPNWRAVERWTDGDSYQ